VVYLNSDMNKSLTLWLFLKLWYMWRWVD